MILLVLLPLLLVPLATPLSWTVLFGALFVILFITIALVNDRWTLVAFLLVRPAADLFADQSLLTFGGISINLSSILGVCAIIWSMIILLRYRPRSIWTPVVLLFLLFLLVAGVSALHGESLEITVRELVRLGSVLALMLSSMALIRTRYDSILFVRAVAASLGIPLLVAAVQFVTRTGLSFGDISNRMSGTFAHPNVFAFALVIGLGIVVTLLVSAKNKVQRQFFAATDVLLLVFLLLTYTRSAWIGAGVLLLLFGLVRYRKVLLSVLLSLAIAVALYPAVNAISLSVSDVDLNRTAIVRRIMSPGSDEDNSIEWRLMVWSDMSRKVAEQPLVGHGLGSFPTLRERQTNDLFQDPEAHNDYLRLAVETGFLGLAAYCGLLLTLLETAIHRAIIYTDTRRWIALGLAGTTLAVMVMSFFDNILQATAVAWMFWSLAGVALVFTSRSAPK